MQKYNYEELIEFLKQDAQAVDKANQLVKESKYPFLIFLLDLWGIYEQDIVREKKYYTENNKMLDLKENFEWLFTLNDEQIEELIYQADDIMYNLTQFPVSRPSIMSKIVRGDKRESRIYSEKLYTDIFSDNGDYFNEKNLKYLPTLQSEFDQRKLTIEDFEGFINNTDEKKIYDKFSWAEAFPKEHISKEPNEIVYELVGDSKYKYVLTTNICTPYVPIGNNYSSFKTLLNKIFSVTHDDKIELIKDFSQQNAKQIKDIEERYISKVKPKKGNNLKLLIGIIDSKLLEFKSLNGGSMNVNVKSGNILIDNFDLFWHSYDEGIANILKSADPYVLLQDMIALFRLRDELLNQIIDKTIDYISEVYQGFSGFPTVCNFVSPKNFKYRYRIFLEKIYYDLFHENRDLYNSTLIKYLFEEEKTLINQ
jgi:hypothetical protein